MLAFRGLRKVSGKLLACLDVGFNLGWIFGRRRGRRSTGTGGQENGQETREKKFHRF
jgi:hypothetical protein